MTDITTYTEGVNPSQISTPKSPTDPKKSKFSMDTIKNNWTYILGALVVLALIGFAGWQLWMRYCQRKPSADQQMQMAQQYAMMKGGMGGQPAYDDGSSMGGYYRGSQVGQKMDPNMMQYMGEEDMDYGGMDQSMAKRQMLQQSMYDGMEDMGDESSMMDGMGSMNDEPATFVSKQRQRAG